MAYGIPLSLAIRSGTRRTRNPTSDVSTSIAGHSRVQSATMVSIQITFPPLMQSLSEIYRPTFVRLNSLPPFATAPLQRIPRRCRSRTNSSQILVLSNEDGNRHNNL
jgi:hypothetical protein